MAACRLSAEAAAAFLHLQFDARRQHYGRHFRGAAHSIIEVRGTPVGRLYLHHTEDAVRVVDISLLPGHRDAGIGTSILTDLLTSAHAAGRSVRLRVAALNPAQRLYRRLGFVVVGETERDSEMEAPSASGASVVANADLPDAETDEQKREADERREALKQHR